MIRSMRRRAPAWPASSLAAVAALALVGGAACTSRGGHEDLLPPPDFVPPAIRPLRVSTGHGQLGFGNGFFAQEWDSEGHTWRWTGARGEIRFENDGKSHRLRLTGWVPLELLSAPPTVRLTMGDHLVDSFVATERTLRKEYSLGPGDLGTAPVAVLVIETSTTARAPNDLRDLGVAIEQVGWQ